MRRLLRVNLSNGAIKEEGIPQKIALDYVGGRGFGSKSLYYEVAAGWKPKEIQALTEAKLNIAKGLKEIEL